MNVYNQPSSSVAKEAWYILLCPEWRIEVHTQGAQVLFDTYPWLSGVILDNTEDSTSIENMANYTQQVS